MAELTKLTGTYIRSGSIPTTALSGGVVSSSLQVISALPGGTISSSAQVTALLPTDVVSSSVQVKSFLPEGTVSASSQYPGWVTSSTQVNYTELQNIPSGIASSSAQVKAYLPTDTVSSSAQVTAFLPTGAVSSSGQVDITNTTNYTSFSSSIATIDTTQTSRLAALENVTGSYATTGSNTFVAPQTISDTTNSTSYLDGALHIAGGMSVRKDVRISGSMTINGLLTAVSMSTQYVTSSQYNVGVSRITLNDDDNVRFAGLSIIDSGSSSPTSASIYWDSLQHRFLYENLSGSAYNSAILIAGPKHTGSLGDESGLTTGYIPVATGDDHISNSVMFQTGSNISIGTTTTPTAGAKVKIATATRTAAFFDLDATGGENWIIDSTNTAGSTDVLGIYPYGGTGLYIRDNGNVGIGTASPARVLTVYTSGSASRILLQNNATGTAINNGFDIAMETDGVATVWNYQNSYMRFGTNNTERMRIDAAGSLLVGGTSTAAGGLVQIQSSSNTIISVRSTNGAGTAPGIRFYHDTNDEFVIRGGDGLRFFGSGVNERVVITGAGNVGIGTTNPGYKLDVRGEAVLGYVGNRYLYIDSNANVIARGETGGWAMSHAFRGSANTDRGGFGALGANDALTYYWIGADYSNATMVLTSGSAGNVGINTTSPNRKLVVYGTSDTYVSIVGGTSNVASLLFGDTSSDSVGRITYNNSTDSFSFLTNSNDRMFISGSGNVGIGTTNPSYKVSTQGTGDHRIYHYNSGTTTSDNAIIQAEVAGDNSGNAFFCAGKTGLVWSLGRNTTTGNFEIRSNFNLANDASSRLIIKTTGEVGIGTTDPAGYKLNITGGATRVASYLSFGDNGYIRADASGWLQFQGGTSGTRIMEKNNSAALVTVLDGGNVGIGTTNPIGKLQLGSNTFSGTNGLYANSRIGAMVNGSLTSIVYASTYNDPSYPDYGLVFIHGANTSNYNVWSISPDGPAKGDGLNFIYELNSTNIHPITPKVVFKGNGNVGIGTTNPSNAKLQLAGSANSFIIDADANAFDGRAVLLPGRFFVGTLGGGYPEIGYNFNAFNSTYTKLANDTAWRITFGANNRMDFGYAGSGTGAFSWNTAMSINTSGNVGIGTTSPGATSRLHIAGSTQDNITILYTGTSGGHESGVRFEDFRGQQNAFIGNNLDNDGVGVAAAHLVFKTSTGGTVSERIRITTSGNVGIGTTNPGSYKLQVQGDTYVTGTLTEGSSIALKKNINPITDALNIIKNLTGYTFDRTDSDATNQAGLIAEEVAQVLPGVVSLDQDGNPAGVQYTKIIAYLVESIKELKSELDILKRQ